MQRADLLYAYNIAPALHSVLFHFTHQVTSGYSISLIGDPARGPCQFCLLHFFNCIQTVFPTELKFTINLLTPRGLFQMHLIGGLNANVTISRIKKKNHPFVFVFHLYM